MGTEGKRRRAAAILLAALGLWAGAVGSGRAAEPATVAVAPPQAAPVVVRPDAALPAWRRHAVPAPAAEGRPMIAVVIDDAGLNRAASARAMALPGPLTIAFMTYAEDLEDQAARARAAGHEILLHVPMEPRAASADPGPNALLAGLAAAETLRRLRWGLDRLEGYVGVNNHMGSRFTASAEDLRPVLLELRRRGLLFLDSRTAADSVAGRLARAMGLPSAERDLFLDDPEGEADLPERLAQLEAIARRQGHAIAIGHPRRATLDALAAWLPGLADRGLVLVPLSAIVAHRLVPEGGVSSAVPRSAPPPAPRE